MRVVTTVSRPMEVAMYKAVNTNIAAIKATPGAHYPSYMRIGAELQNPKNGEILATYPGPGWNMTPKECAKWNCDVDMSIYAREQVGSSFKPYVLSAAVADGMNANTSILNAAPNLCVPPDYDALKLSKDMKYYSTSACSQNNLSAYFPVQNDGGEVIGDPKKLYGVSPQVALAQSSNTAFTDLAHRVTTSKIIQMAQAYGVNISAFKQGGSNLDQMVGQVGLALGTASLTVNEQATMLSTIADNGVYHTAHIVKYWQSPDGPKTPPIMQTRGVLDPTNAANNTALASQVQYAMSMTTVNGTGTGAAVGLGNRPIIAKTGTTSNSHSGFFIGAIPQYSLVVGMFTESQDVNSPESLEVLTGGGFGGYWPAKIWNSFAQAEFASLPVQNFQNAVFSGNKWNQVGKLPKKKPTSCMVTINGKKVKIPLTGKNKGKKCSQVHPTPTPTPTPSGRHHHTFPPNPSPSASPTFGFPTGSASPTGTPTGTTTPTGTATATATGTTPTPGGFGGNTATENGVKAGLAVGGVLMVLPGSLLWTTMSRRRRRRRKGTAQ
jgi:membrane peptidoglycan carboxypeptidase